MPLILGLAGGFWKMLTGGGIAAIGKVFVDAHRDTLTAENTTEKTVADLAARELDLEAKTAEFNSRVVISEQGNWFTRWVRPVWAFPYIVLTFKVVIYDWCLGWGTTYEPKGFFANLGITIAASYFGGRSIEKVAGIISQRRALAGN